MKIGIVGTGFVGGACANAIMTLGLARELVLVDRTQSRAIAEAEDIMHATPFAHTTDVRAGTYNDLTDAKIILITAGANQREGETRLDLVEKNTKIMIDIVPQIMKYAPSDVILIVISNPLDVMVQVVTTLSGLPSNRVIGTGTILDSARFKILLSKQLSLSPQSIHAFVLGEHGDSEVLNWESVRISCLSLDDYCKQVKIPFNSSMKRSIEYRVKNAAYTIISGKGATWYGIGAAAADLVKCIVNDEKRILTTSIVTRKFIPKPVAFSLPRIIGQNGVIDTVMPELSASELRTLKISAITIRKHFDSVS